MKYLIYPLSLILFFCFSINVQAHDLQQDLKQSANSKVVIGHIEALVVLIEFADREAYFTKNEVDSFFNQVGYSKYGNNGSVHDYWDAVSQSRVNVHTTVTDYFKAPKTFDYYDTEDGGHTQELLKAALEWLDGTGFDFSTLSVDDDNKIKGLSFQFVGNSGAKGLWGHSSRVSTTYDGVSTYSYQISELGDSEMRLGGICHEQGHMFFGWPDTYDIDSSNGGSNGCGNFDLMAGGNSDNTGAPSQNPVPPNPYFRYLAGWNDLIPLNSFPNDTTIEIIANRSNTYVYRNPDRAGEMFIIEARTKPNRNVDLPGEGVLLWHIDSVISNNAYQQHTEMEHYKVSVVQADGSYHLENGSNRGDSNDFFKGPGQSIINYSHTKWWNGAYSGLAIRNIGAPEDTMVVDFGTNNSEDIAVKSTSTVGGSVSPLGMRYYDKNSDRTFTATASDGFEIEDCIVDGVSQGAISSYTFYSLEEYHTIDFLFYHVNTDLTEVTKNSVDYSFYEGAWNSMPDFNELTPSSTGNARTISATISGKSTDNYGIRYEGYILAPETGEYTFYLRADDGASFSVDGIHIVSNQVQDETNGVIRLEAGYHPFIMDFFEAQISQSLSFYWSGPSIPKSRVSPFYTGSEYTDVKNISNESSVNIWVNINSELVFECYDQSTILVEVYNVSGMLINRELLDIVGGKTTMGKFTSDKGIYFVRVKTDNNVLLQQKIVL